MLRDMGIEHVYDSRSMEFAEQIRHDTDGYGVDIVLNSLTGAAQRAGIELLAVGGRFVEIGKGDIYGNTRLGLYPFRRDLAFYDVDLALMSVGQPERVRELLRNGYRLTADGVLPHAANTRTTRWPRPRPRSGRWAPPSTPASCCSTSRGGTQQRGGAAGAGSGVPARRRLHHHRWAGRARSCSWPRRWPAPVAAGSC